MTSALICGESRSKAGETVLLFGGDKERKKESKSVKRQRSTPEASGDDKSPAAKRERRDSTTTTTSLCPHCKIYGHTQESCSIQNSPRKQGQQQKHLRGKPRRFSNHPPPIKRSPGRPPRSTVKMSNRYYDVFEQDELSNDALQAAADLFSSNYGVWGEKAAGTVGSWAEKGEYIVNIFLGSSTLINNHPILPREPR